VYRLQELKLRLFFSADLIGSTASKQHAGSDLNPVAWRETVLEFLIDFPREFADRCAERGAPLVPELYKSIGDELVFAVRLQGTYREAAAYIAAFADTLTLFMSDSDRPPVKGAAWIASFPLANMEIDVERTVKVRIDGKEQERVARQIEYIGPQMDVGFRVAKFSSSMHLTLALDLALLLLTAKMEQVETAQAMRFHYEGREVLKGVSNEKPYPVITLLIPGSHDYVELRLKGEAPHECATAQDLADLADLCRRFLTSNEPMFVPYLVSCDTFTVIPPSHRVLLEADDV
jgi:hypothetical protein